MDNIPLCTWQRGNLERVGLCLWDSKQELVHPGEGKAPVHCIGIESPFVPYMPDSYRTEVEKYRLISVGTNFSRRSWDLWAGRPTESLLLNLLFSSGILNTESLKSTQGTMSIFWRGDTLAGQLQWLNICSCERSRAFPPAALTFHTIPAHLPVLRRSCLCNLTVLFKSGVQLSVLLPELP